MFAPTDAAFEALPEGTLDALLADQDALADVLLYHVLTDEVTSDEVVALTSATMANGADVEITVDGSGNVRVNDANVTVVDVETTNGVIHVIDAVLTPPSE